MRPTYDGKDDADAPHAHGVDGQQRVVDRRHDRAHLGERRVVGFIGEDLLGIAVVDIYGLLRLSARYVDEIWMLYSTLEATGSSLFSPSAAF